MPQSTLTRKILDVLRRERVARGFHLREQWLADTLGVSRSPVRSALKELHDHRIVRLERGRGYFLAAEPGSDAFEQADLPLPETERLYLRIASERFANILPPQVSVADLCKRFGASRSTVAKVLNRMQEDGLVEKAPGHGWTFGPALNDEAAYAESYRFRLLIEPAALLETAFSLPPDRLDQLRQTHLDLMDAGLERVEVSAIFDADADFHDTLAESSRNRFLAQAVRQQTRLRRLSEYEKYTSRDRWRDSLAEHLSILDAIETGAMAEAADRMSLHIRMSDRNRPDFRKVRVLAHRRLTRR